MEEASVFKPWFQTGPRQELTLLLAFLPLLPVLLPLPHLLLPVLFTHIMNENDNIELMLVFTPQLSWTKDTGLTM